MLPHGMGQPDQHRGAAEQRRARHRHVAGRNDESNRQYGGHGAAAASQRNQHESSHCRRPAIVWNVRSPRKPRTAESFTVNKMRLGLSDAHSRTRGSAQILSACDEATISPGALVHDPRMPAVGPAGVARRQLRDGHHHQYPDPFGLAVRHHSAGVGQLAYPARPRQPPARRFHRRSRRILCDASADHRQSRPRASRPSPTASPARRRKGPRDRARNSRLRNTGWRRARNA